METTHKNSIKPVGEKARKTYATAKEANEAKNGELLKTLKKIDIEKFLANQ